MSDGTSGDEEVKEVADFVCIGDVVDVDGCDHPCYLSCKASDEFIITDMECIFRHLGYESQWKRIKKEAPDEEAS